MMSFLTALHAIAARRGEGLRPELVHLLENSGADPEVDPISKVSRPPADSELAPCEPGGAARFLIPRQETEFASLSHRLRIDQAGFESK